MTDKPSNHYKTGGLEYVLTGNPSKRVHLKTGGMEYYVLTGSPFNHYKTGGLEYYVLTGNPSNHYKNWWPGILRIDG